MYTRTHTTSGITPLRFAFFGTPDRAVWALEILKSKGLLPELIVTQPDKPTGRKLLITPPPVKVWAEQEKIPVVQPEKMSDAAFLETLKRGNLDLFVVVAYGKIIPEALLGIPKLGAINLHASLLPKLRGASPIETSILNDDKNTGVSIILMDKEMDHGPILAEKAVATDGASWPPSADELARLLINEGADLLAETMTNLHHGKTLGKIQDETKATYTKKITKEDGLLDLAADPYKNFLKFQAYKTWPGTFFFTEKDGRKTRIKITDAEYKDGIFTIKKVTPEGKNETDYASFVGK